MNIIPSSIGRKYGWHRPKLANRRMRLVFHASGVALPDKFDLLANQPDVPDQAQEGSCTANSAGGEMQYQRRRGALPPDFMPSRSLLYSLEREDDGTALTDDAGSSIEESVAAMEKYGVVSEADWPYDQDHFALAPTPDILSEASKFKVLMTQPVALDVQAIKESIFAGFGVLYGFTVFESFEDPSTASSGICPMPQPGEQILGGHANRWIGWDDSIAGGSFLSRNSWGPSWGLSGNFFMPYQFAVGMQYASDLHNIQRVS